MTFHDQGLRKRRPGFQNRTLTNSQAGAIAIPNQGWGIVPVRVEGLVRVDVYRDRQIVYTKKGFRTEKAAMLAGREWIQRVGSRT